MSPNPPAQPPTPEAVELTARLVRCEEQRNNAMNQVVLQDGQLALAGHKIGEMNTELVRLQEIIGERDQAIAEGLEKVAQLTAKLAPKPARKAAPRRKKPASKARKR